MYRPSGIGDHDTFGRKLGQQLVALLAFAQRSLSRLALGDVHHRAGDQLRGATRVVELPASIENVGIRTVGAVKSVFVRPVAGVAPHELLKFAPDSLDILGMDAAVPIIQSNL